MAPGQVAEVPLSTQGLTQLGRLELALWSQPLSWEGHCPGASPWLCCHCWSASGCFRSWLCPLRQPSLSLELLIPVSLARLGGGLASVAQFSTVGHPEAPSHVGPGQVPATYFLSSFLPCQLAGEPPAGLWHYWEIQSPVSPRRAAPACAPCPAQSWPPWLGPSKAQRF